MFGHLDKNGSWVLLIFLIVFAALIAATVYTTVRTRARKSELERYENAAD